MAKANGRSRRTEARQRVRPITGLAAALATLGLLAASCTRDEPRESTEPESTQRGQESDAEVWARVDGKAITGAEVDDSLRLALHDLDQARHQLRAERLEEIIETRLGRDADSPGATGLPEGRVEILLKPPEPPRLPVGPDGAPIRGAPDAPVTIVEFLDFESPHCRRMQPVLREILERYPGEVRLAVRDLPLPFHRHAQGAAQAAACAGEQGAYWAYHDVLLQEHPELGRAQLDRYALRVGLDPERFARCMDSGLFAQKVAADLRAAQQLGVGVAPTFFVNGAYLKGPQTFAALAAVIDRELGRPARPTPSRSSAHPSPDEAALLEAQPSELPRLPPDLVPEPDAVLTLRRTEISRALHDRPSLQRRLDPSTGRYGGRRLLKLSEVQPGDLFDRLGLQARDVLLLVDGEWITEEHNPLWQRLEERGEVTLVFMRRGLPQALHYVIQ